MRCVAAASTTALRDLAACSGIFEAAPSSSERREPCTVQASVNSPAPPGPPPTGAAGIGWRTARKTAARTDRTLRLKGARQIQEDLEEITCRRNAICARRAFP